MPKELEGKVPMVHVGETRTDEVNLLVDARIKQLTANQEIRIVTIDVDERLKELVKNAAIAQITNALPGLQENHKRLLRYIAVKKTSSLKELWAVHSNKEYHGKAVSLFYAMLSPLKSANLITVNDDTATWNLPDALTPLMSREDAEKAEQYIKSLIL